MEVKQTTNWFNLIFLFLLHIVGVAAGIYYVWTHGLSWSLLGLTIAFYFLTGFSITAGYHRLFAHKSYEATPMLEYFYLIFGAAAFENSALKWCYDHRVHHRFVDEDEDPYNAKKGFLYSHMGWIIKDKKSKDYPHFRRDLSRNPRVQWQHKNYLPLAVFFSFILPALIASLWGEALGGFLIAGIARVVFVHHGTFFINSLAHMWGRQPYTDENTARDNPFLALFTYGEGYHNFHHLFHNDYRNGIRWYHFDPTKWLIKMTSKVGMATKLTRTSPTKIMRARLAMKYKMIDEKKTLTDLWTIRLNQMSRAVDEKYDTWLNEKARYKKEYEKFKLEKTKLARQKIKEIKLDMAEARSNYKLAYRSWEHSTRLMLSSR